MMRDDQTYKCTDHDGHTIKIIDTSESLTSEELKAIKDIIQMTKSAKLLLALVIAIVGILGIDKALAALEKIIKLP